MYVRFWGTRGSIATPGHRTARYGGNTACVEVRAADGTLIVLDCGTGARELGLHLVETTPTSLRVHLFIGHTHWDHIQGFPFFAPAFLPGAEVNIYAPVGFQRSLGEAMAGQMDYAYFPVKLKDLRSRIHFTELDEGFFRLGEVLVETQYLNHTAPTIAYRITSGGATLAYATDHEPFWRNGRTLPHPGDQRHVAFLRGAHLIIHDAQYTEEEYETRRGWGHSSVGYATDVALAAGAERLALFHHDPTHDDGTMAGLETLARTSVAREGGRLEVFAAAEGLELEIKGQRAPCAATVADDSAFRRVSVAGRRIAIVDADAAEIESIERELAEDCYVVLSMPDAASARKRLPEIGPDIVIISRELPDGDGTELIGRVRSAFQRPDFPVLLLTNEPATSDGVTGWADGAPTDYIARPFSPAMLRARVRAWLTRSLAPESLPSAIRPEAGHPVATDPAGVRHVELLTSVPLLRVLTREQLASIAREGIEQTYSAGHVIAREGTPSSSLFIILSGRVRVSELSRETQAEIALSELGPGEFFGELGVLRNQPRAATVVALEPTRCLALPPGQFLRAIETIPSLALRLIQVLAARLTEADRKVAGYAPDPLTGLVSRRAFLEQYRRLAAGAHRRQAAVLAVLVDVRGLATVNDGHGYTMGDEVLKTVAEGLKEATRTTDLVSRCGGDEFAVLMVDVDEHDVERILMRIQEAIQGAMVRRGLPPVVCSFGAAVAREAPESADDLFRLADADRHRRRMDA